MRRIFSSFMLTALVIFGAAASAIPPGTDDEISLRLAPHGKLARSEKTEIAMTTPRLRLLLGYQKFRYLLEMSMK